MDLESRLQHVISMEDFTREQILEILAVTADVKQAWYDGGKGFRDKYQIDVHDLLKGKLVITGFLENSTRTNFSHRIAAQRAGAIVDGFPSAAYTSIAKHETFADTFSMFSLWTANVLIMRTKYEGVARWIAQELDKLKPTMEYQNRHVPNYLFNVPMIINGGDGKNQHPTQCLLDLFTMYELAQEKGMELNGLNIALLNDLANGRTTRSLMSVAHHFDFNLHLAYPDPRFAPPPYLLELLHQRGLKPTDYGTQLLDALRAADIAYQTRIQRERIGQAEDLEAIAKNARITNALMATLGSDAPFVLHPLPIDGEINEIDSSLKGNNHLFRANQQAQNGFFLRIALMALGTGAISPQNGLIARRQYRELVKEPLSFDNNKERGYSASGYIQGDGLVVDDIDPQIVRRLEAVLGWQEKGLPAIPTGYHGTEDPKIKLHTSYELSQQELNAIAVIAPGARVSYIQGGNIINQYRVFPPEVVRGLIKCGNNPCITNNQIEGAVPIHYIEDDAGEIIRCGYCDHREPIQSVHNDKRFIYIGQS